MEIFSNERCHNSGLKMRLHIVTGADSQNSWRTTMKKFLVSKPRSFGKQKKPIPLGEIGFLAITILAMFGPTALLCMAMGQVWPLVLVAGTDAVGATLGAVAFNTVNQPVLSCVSSVSATRPAERTDVIDLKKAA